MYDIINIETPDSEDLIILSENHNEDKQITAIYDRVEDIVYLPVNDKDAPLIIGLANYMQCDLRVVFSSRKPLDLDIFDGDILKSALSEFGIVVMVAYPSLNRFFDRVEECNLNCNALYKLQQNFNLQYSTQLERIESIPLEAKIND